MDPRILTIEPKRLVGNALRMSLAEDRTVELFRTFMPRRKEIVDVVSSDIFLVRTYEWIRIDLSNFNPADVYAKWAAIEVNHGRVRNLDKVPEGMMYLEMPGGLYAVFDHKGGPAAAPQTFGYIFGAWLPGSDYQLDNRPHFEVLGEKYGDGGPESEEEIWVPIRLK